MNDSLSFFWGVLERFTKFFFFGDIISDSITFSTILIACRHLSCCITQPPCPDKSHHAFHETHMSFQVARTYSLTNANTKAVTTWQTTAPCVQFTAGRPAESVSAVSGSGTTTASFAPSLASFFAARRMAAPVQHTLLALDCLRCQLRNGTARTAPRQIALSASQRPRRGSCVCLNSSHLKQRVFQTW